MCGIIGYIGKDDIEKKLIENLKLLEYRGYDSSGIATLNNGSIQVTKKDGNISCLEKILKHHNNSTIGIAHTRWATHGKPSVKNAHPHLSNDKVWAVVHNGIIENFSELKHELEHNNYQFISETDTEIIPNLFQYLYNKCNIETIINACDKLNGSYALAIINKNQDNTIYLAKKKSPLYVAKNNNEILIASDPICFVGKFNEYYSLEDNEFCEANLDNITFYNNNKEIINKSLIKLDNFETKVDKNNYPHYMIKEIEETPQILKNVALTYKQKNIFSKINKELIEKINKIIFIGCGTAYHAGLMASNYIENFAKIDSKSYIASEFRYSNPLIDEKTLVICISQSGETADTLMAQELAKSKGAKTIALTNVLYSTIAKKCDIVLPTCAGPEMSVASTKAYSSQLSILNMLAKHIANIKFGTNYEYIDELLHLAENLEIQNISTLKELSKELENTESVFYIGRNLDYISCEEASLKLKEITYINSQAYPAGELKHGFLALVDDTTYVFVIATKKELFEKTLNGAFEAKSRGAKLILASQFDIPSHLKDNFHKVIKLQNYSEDIMPIATIIHFQLLSYFTSINKNINPDQPRNLAKSVTVE